MASPLIDVAVRGDPAAIDEFAQTPEEIGYQDLSAPDHVLGVNGASPPDWGDRTSWPAQRECRPRDGPDSAFVGVHLSV